MSQSNFKFIAIVGIISTLLACNFERKASIQIKNNFEYPISLTFITNNIQQVYNDIKPNQQLKSTYDWTKLEKTDGEFLIIINHSTTHQKDTFHYGQYLNGELGNYIDIETHQNELKVVVSD